jgi:hypothetical protein
LHFWMNKCYVHGIHREFFHSRIDWWRILDFLASIGPLPTVQEGVTCRKPGSNKTSPKHFIWWRYFHNISYCITIVP